MAVINFSIGRHDVDGVVVLSTFLLAAMMAIGWYFYQLFYWLP
jgi:hypothetical protein